MKKIIEVKNLTKEYKNLKAIKKAVKTRVFTAFTF